jgi:hypothetical protein
MYHERIRSNPHWHSHDTARYDTVFVVMNESQPGMRGMVVARVLLFFSFTDPYLGKEVPCALVNWFVHTRDKPDEDTGMWVVEPELELESRGDVRTIEVVHLDTIARGAHLLPIYGTDCLPEDFHYMFALDAFKSYFVNHGIDHHAHEFLT